MAHMEENTNDIYEYRHKCSKLSISNSDLTELKNNNSSWQIRLIPGTQAWYIRKSTNITNYTDTWKCRTTSFFPFFFQPRPHPTACLCPPLPPRPPAPLQDYNYTKKNLSKNSIVITEGKIRKRKKKTS